jgi:hypothetical protein
MKKIFFLSIIFLSVSCKTLKSNSESKLYSKKEWITIYKNRVVLTCLKKTGINLEKDNSGAIQFEIIGSNLKLIHEIDSVGNKYAQEILNSPSYFEGKPIINKILEIYKSKELSALAKNCYKKYNREN